MDNLALEIRRQVARYLAGDISVAEFHRSIAPLAWNIGRRADNSAGNIAHEVDLLLAEFSHGDWDERELKQHLQPLVEDYVVFPEDAIVTGSSSSFSRASISLDPAPTSPFGIQSVKAFA